MSEKRALVLDTSAFISGFDPFSVQEELYTVPLVEQELVQGSLARLRFNTASEVGRIKVIVPNSESLDDAKRLSGEAGDVSHLSEVDMHILALAVQLKKNGLDPSIVTDDYSIQNVAKKIDVNFVSLITFGIRFFLQWLLYCPACHRSYPPDYQPKHCEICGTVLKRKPVKKTPI